MASTLPLRPHPPLLSGLQRPPIKSTFPIPFRVRRNPNRSFSPIAASPSDPSPSSSWEREEIRWLREEQRWLREEKRWIREESRWMSERESLLREIAALRLRIEALEHERPPIEVEIRAAKEGSRIIAAAGVPQPVLVEEAEVKKVVLEEEVRVSERKEEGEKKKKKKMLRNTLRMGSEGEDVRAMQVCVVPLRC